MVAVEDYAPGDYYYVKSTEKMAPAEWTWVWKVVPVDVNTSRLINRFKIGMPSEAAGNPAVAFLIYNGGFVMEQNMMQGIAQRAEGRGEFALIEPVEIALWLAALLTGLWAARMYLRQEKWQAPLAFGLLAVAWLFVLTFVQPAIWLRLVGDAALIAGIVWAQEHKPTAQAAKTDQRNAVRA